MCIVGRGNLVGVKTHKGGNLCILDSREGLLTRVLRCEGADHTNLCPLIWTPLIFKL